MVALSAFKMFTGAAGVYLFIEFAPGLFISILELLNVTNAKTFQMLKSESVSYRYERTLRLADLYTHLQLIIDCLKRSKPKQYLPKLLYVFFFNKRDFGILRILGTWTNSKKVRSNLWENWKVSKDLPHDDAFIRSHLPNARSFNLLFRNIWVLSVCRSDSFQVI